MCQAQFIVEGGKLRVFITSCDAQLLNHQPSTVIYTYRLPWPITCRAVAQAINCSTVGRIASDTQNTSRPSSTIQPTPRAVQRSFQVPPPPSTTPPQQVESTQHQQRDQNSQTSHQSSYPFNNNHVNGVSSQVPDLSEMDSMAQELYSRVMAHRPPQVHDALLSENISDEDSC